MFGSGIRRCTVLRDITRGIRDPSAEKGAHPILDGHESDRDEKWRGTIGETHMLPGVAPGSGTGLRATGALKALTERARTTRKVRMTLIWEGIP